MSSAGEYGLVSANSLSNNLAKVVRTQLMHNIFGWLDLGDKKSSLSTRDTITEMQNEETLTRNTFAISYRNNQMQQEFWRICPQIRASGIDAQPSVQHLPDLLDGFGCGKRSC